METIFKALKSRTTWTLVFAFAFNGWQAISASFGPEFVLFVNGAFSLAALYFKLNPSQKY